MATFAGRKMRPGYARLLLGMGRLSWGSKNRDPSNAHSRPVSTTERQLMAVLSEVIPPSMQKQTEDVLIRIAREDGMEIDPFVEKWLEEG